MTDLPVPKLDAPLRANLDRVTERLRRAVADDASRRGPAADPAIGSAQAQAQAPAPVPAPAQAQAPALVLVSKSVGVDVTERLLHVAHEIGLGPHIPVAENRADAFRDKAAAIDARIEAAPLPEGAAPEWHFIGHLQRNKARRVLERADVLHSVDSKRLAETVARITTELEREVRVFVEVNLTGEDQKHGLAPDEVASVVELLAACSWTPVLGLMAMGPLPGSDRTTDATFASASSLARQLEARFKDAFVGGRCRLSMGMSGDLESAVEHGTDYVRIGSALFEGLDGTPETSPIDPSSQPPKSQGASRA